MTLSEGKDLATIVLAIIGIATLVKGVIEYTAQGAQKRAEQFLEMRKRLKDNATFKELCALLETDDPGLIAIPFKEKRDLLGFFEEVALMLNSGLIREPVAHYMFGYYAIRCWESNNFWSGVSRESTYWSLFRDFVKRMKARETSFKYKRHHFSF